jgi:hypothetical protein
MTRSWLTYHRVFPWTPMSGWSGARLFGWTLERTASGQWKRPRKVQHPFPTSLKLWCLLHVEFGGVALGFATPRELDQFLDVMGQRLLPSGARLAATWGSGATERPQHRRAAVASWRSTTRWRATPAQTRADEVVNRC